MKNIFRITFLFLLFNTNVWNQEIYKIGKINAAKELAYDLKLAKASLKMPNGFILLASDSLKQDKCSDYYSTTLPIYSNTPTFYLINEKQNIIIGFDSEDWRPNSGVSKILPAKNREEFFINRFSKYLNYQDMRTLFLYDSVGLTNLQRPDNYPAFSGEYRTKCDLKLNNKYDLYKVIFGWLPNGLLVRYFYYYDPKTVNIKTLNKLIKHTFSIIN